MQAAIAKTALTKGIEQEVRAAIAPSEKLSLDLPPSGRRAAPGEPVPEIFVCELLHASRSIVANTMARMSAKSPKVVRKATAKQVTAKPGLRSGRRLGEASQPTARRTNASGPVRSAWGRFGTCLVQRLSRASRVYWPAPSWLFSTKPGRRTSPLVATTDEGDCSAGMPR